ncbi:death-associated protein kinase 1-like [Saccoglossus kowalevskii]|uniref:Uncharacterized protein LOC102803719 n=1 Tax=Saccoglossus kowalevskii TaxID=10224 RepID=A0ABM0M4T8_SACKO|nr:PREDICTED: uncharacterized protein LOC102803719 [Saccoglossus kowalevskii]
MYFGESDTRFNFCSCLAFIALGLDDRIGNFMVGKEFDALLIETACKDSPFDTFDGHYKDTFEDYYRAAQEGNLDVIKSFISNVEDLDRKYFYYQRTLVTHASSYGQREVVETLINAGASAGCKEANGNTAIHFASHNGHSSVVEVLLRHGVDPNCKNNEGQTPLYLATLNNNIEVVKVLIQYRCDVNSLFEKNNALYTILRYPIRHLTSSKFEESVQKQEDALGIVKLLVEADINIDHISTDGRTPLEVTQSNIGRHCARTTFYKGAEHVILGAKLEKVYQELMIEKGVPVTVGKLYICGHCGAGKSTLKRSLLLSTKATDAPPPGDDKYIPTAGIEVENIFVPGIGKVSLWDYAGHAEFFVTHTMFLGARTATFVVLYQIADYHKKPHGVEIRRPFEIMEEQKNKVLHWLRLIKATNPSKVKGQEGQKPTVILVASRADWAAQWEQEAKQVAKQITEDCSEIMKDHLNIVDECFVINGHEPDTADMARLRNLLNARITNVLQNEKPMPSICDKIAKNIHTLIGEKKLYPVMHWDDYYSHVKETIDSNIEEHFLDKATDYLYNMGEILYFKSDDASYSGNIIVLEPQWFCERVIGPMLASNVFNQYTHRLGMKEIYTRPELEKVLNDRADVELLVKLLEAFELLFPLTRGSGSVAYSYIIPGLLPSDMPDNQWRMSATKRRYFGRRVHCLQDTDNFSPGFFSRLQTRLYLHFTSLGHRPSGIWRNGIKVCDSVEGLVYMTDDRRAVHVCVRTEDDEEIGECSRLLNLVTQDIYDVLRTSCPGTNVGMCILSPQSLRDHENPEDICYYTLQQVCEAEIQKRKVYDEIVGRTEVITDLLCPGHDRTFLDIQRYQCDVKWLLQKTKEELIENLEIEDPSGLRDHRIMAQYMGISNSERQYMARVAYKRNTTVTEMILNKWSENWAKKRKRDGPSAVKYENTSYGVYYYESSIDNLLKIINEIDHYDVKCAIIDMFELLQRHPKDVGV